MQEINMKPKSMRFFWWGSIFFLLFLGLFGLETARFFRYIDVSSAIFLQKIIPRAFDVPLSLLSILGNFEFMFAYLVILLVIFYRKTGKIGYPFIFLFGMILFIELLGKYLLYHPNPPDFLLRYTFPFDVPHVSVQTKYSFPSGHVSRTFFVCIVSVFVFGKRRLSKSIAVLFSLLMAISRVYLGEHWLSDVLAGALLGGSMGFFTLLYY